MNTMTGLSYKRILYALGCTIFLYATMLLTGCTTFFQTRENEADVENSSEPESTLTSLKYLFQQAYNAREHPDSLRQAAHYLTELLDRMGPNTADREDLQEKKAELNYLCATYTSLDADSSKLLYEQGSQAAASLLESHPALHGFIFNATVPSNSAVLEQLSDPVLDVVYWWSLNYMFWLRKESPLARLVARAKIERAIRVIRAVHPDYRWGAVPRLTGLMLLISPDGDLNRAREAFQQAISSESDYLENRYFYGRYYGVLLKNKQVFHTQLDSTVRHNPGKDLPYAWLNTLVQIKAVQSLAQENTYFFSITHSDILKSAATPTD